MTVPREAVEKLGMDLMDTWNARVLEGSRAHPYELAVMGHAIDGGYEFIIDRGGVTYAVTLEGKTNVSSSQGTPQARGHG